MSLTSDIKANVDLVNAFTKSSQFDAKNLEQRLEWAHKNFAGQLALISSFGVQSFVLLKALQVSQLPIPVVHIDIQESQYDKAREYRDAVYKKMGFDLHVFSSPNEDEKDKTRNRALQELGIKAQISGVRSVQTPERKNKTFIGLNPDNSVIEISPLLDWTSQDIHAYSKICLEDGIIQSAYQEGLISKGGRVLSVEEALKFSTKECGLHALKNL